MYTHRRAYTQTNEKIEQNSDITTKLFLYIPAESFLLDFHPPAALGPWEVRR
jgi:hypothetical protein